MYTLVETPTFAAHADRLWTQHERLEFLSWLAANPMAGTVIRRSGGCRKLRWTRGGTGKRGGVRVIYYVDHSEGEIWLLLAYAKSAEDSISGHILRAIRQELEDE